MSVSDIAVQINKLLSGPCAVAYGDATTVDPPVNIKDIISMTGTPTINADYTLFGATKGGQSYTNDIKTSELTIDQRKQTIFEDIDDIARGFKMDVAELSMENWLLLEGATAIETVTATAHASAQKLIRSGSFDEFDRYRIAWIAQRRKSQGVVIEPGGATRGCYVVFGFYSGSLAAASSETKHDVGAFATRSVEFKGFPDADLDPGVDTMFMFEEQPGTISAT